VLPFASEGIAADARFVRDNDVNSALGVLKKKMQGEGTFSEMKRRRAYGKPSERRVLGKAEDASSVIVAGLVRLLAEDVRPRQQMLPIGRAKQARVILRPSQGS
jgi:ribosomal protein S21